MADGTIVHYRASWCAEGLQTSWESGWRITFERGTLLWDDIDEIRVERMTGLGFIFECEMLTVHPWTRRTASVSIAT